MKNRIGKTIATGPDFVIKRVRVSEKIKQLVRGYAKWKGIPQRDVVTLVMIEAFPTKAKARQTLTALREKGPSGRSLTAIVELRVGKAVTS
jgi:hypothetical protein